MIVIKRAPISVRAGFTLLELAIGFLIATLLATALLFSVNQLRKSAAIADQLLALDLRHTVFQNMLGRDLAGAMTPEFGKIEQLFFGASSKEGDLQQLTFITVNPLPVFTNSAQRLVRVQYRLAPMSEAEGAPKAYQLYRSESDQLVMSDLKIANEYAMITEIKGLRVKYLLPKQAKKAAQASDTKMEQPSVNPANATKNESDQKSPASKPELSEKDTDTGAEKERVNPEQNAAPEQQSPGASAQNSAKSDQTGAESAVDSEAGTTDAKSEFTVHQAGEFDHLPAYVEMELELWRDAARQRSDTVKYKFPIYSYKYQVANAAGTKTSADQVNPASAEKSGTEQKPADPQPKDSSMEKDAHSPKSIV